MFTGIVEAVGTVTDVTSRQELNRIQVRAPTIAPKLRLGDSVAVDGACLTNVLAGEESFSFDVIPQTWARTVAGGYCPGTRVNLERPVSLAGLLDGHIVQGHIDGTGHVISRETGPDGAATVEFEVPREVHALTVAQGSIALNGVSLTVQSLGDGGRVTIGLTPHTLRHTNLGGLRPDDAVNVEGDIIGKYLARIAEGSRP